MKYVALGIILIFTLPIIEHIRLKTLIWIKKRQFIRILRKSAMPEEEVDRFKKRIFEKR